MNTTPDPMPDLAQIEKRLRANAMDGRGEWSAVLTADMDAVLDLARRQAAEIERLRTDRDALVRRHHGPRPFAEGRYGDHLWVVRNAEGKDRVFEDRATADRAAHKAAGFSPEPEPTN